MVIKHIDTNNLSHHSLPVYITKVESPALFWVQLKSHREELLELQEEISWKIQRKTKELATWPYGTRAGQLAAASNGIK